MENYTKLMLRSQLPEHLAAKYKLSGWCFRTSKSQIFLDPLEGLFALNQFHFSCPSASETGSSSDAEAIFDKLEM